MQAPYRLFRMILFSTTINYCRRNNGDDDGNNYTYERRLQPPFVMSGLERLSKRISPAKSAHIYVEPGNTPSTNMPLKHTH